MVPVVCVLAGTVRKQHNTGSATLISSFFARKESSMIDPLVSHPAARIQWGAAKEFTSYYYAQSGWRNNSTWGLLIGGVALRCEDAASRPVSGDNIIRCALEVNRYLFKRRIKILAHVAA
jgi:hypothetical protein